MWEREAEYREVLELVIQKAGPSRLDRMAALAVEDERMCYKHVVVILEKQYRKCVANMRGKLHLLYCVSSLLRLSRKQQGARDRYAERLKPLASALVSELRMEFAAQVDKLLKLWRMEGVFNVDQLAEVESGRSALLQRLPGMLSKSPSGSLTETSAQDQHPCLGDASGSGRSSAIQSYPRFTGGRSQPASASALPPYPQPPAAPENQDPYSADSNPNAIRPQPPPPPGPPPPPPPLIPPGLLGPVGPPGMMPQNPAAAAAAAAAAAGLFSQSFLGSAPAALLQQPPFMGPMGPFGAGSLGSGMPVNMGGALPGGMGVGGMGPFPGPPGPMPPGLGIQRPPPYPPQSMYGGQGQGAPSQGQGQRGGAHHSRFNHVHGRTSPGLGPNPIGTGSAHIQGQGWHGRYGHEGPGGLPPGLQQRPPPPPGSPPRAEARTGTGGQGSHKVSSAPEGNAAAAHATGSSVGEGATANGTAPTGTFLSRRPGGRRSRWELERGSDEPPPPAPVSSAAAGVPLEEPQLKRPALAAETSNIPAGVPSAGSAAPHPPPPAPRPPPPPPPTRLPAPPPAAPSSSPPSGSGGGSRTRSPGRHQNGQPHTGDIASTVKPVLISNKPDDGLQRRQDSRPCAETCRNTNPATVATAAALEGRQRAGAATAATTTALSEATIAGGSAGHHPVGHAAQGSSEAVSRDHDMQAVVSTAEVDACGVASAAPEAQAGSGSEADDGGSSSSGTAWRATQQEQQQQQQPDSAASASDGGATCGGDLRAQDGGGRGNGAAEVGNSARAREGQAQDEQVGSQRDGGGANAGGGGKVGAAQGDAQVATAYLGSEIQAPALEQVADDVVMCVEPVETTGKAVKEEQRAAVQQQQVVVGAAGAQPAGIMESVEEAAAEVGAVAVESEGLHDVIRAGQEPAAAAARQKATGPASEAAVEPHGRPLPVIELQVSDPQPAIYSVGAHAAESREVQMGEPEPEAPQPGGGHVDVTSEDHDSEESPEGRLEAGTDAEEGLQDMHQVGPAAEGVMDMASHATGGGAVPPAEEPATTAAGAPVLDAPSDSAPGSSTASGDALPTSSTAAVQANQAELDTAVATSPAGPQPFPNCVAGLGAAELTSALTTAAAAVVQDAVQPQQPARPPEPPACVPAPAAAAHCNGLLLSYDDSRVPLRLEELELGELDDTWL